MILVDIITFKRYPSCVIDQDGYHFRVRHPDLLVEQPAGIVLDGEGRVPQFPLLMTVPEVAGILRLSRKGVYDLLRSGGLGHVKIGRRVRVQRGHLLRFIAQRTVTAF